MFSSESDQPQCNPTATGSQKVSIVGGTFECMEHLSLEVIHSNQIWRSGSYITHVIGFTTVGSNACRKKGVVAEKQTYHVATVVFIPLYDRAQSQTERSSNEPTSGRIKL